MKKIIAFVLTAIFAMSCISASADEIKNSEKFKRYCTILKSAGIETGFSNENNVISREKLAELALKFTKTESEKCTSAKYIDVPLKHYAADLVYTVTQNGYMAGFDDNTFRLNQPAAAYEFARVLLYMLDYGTMAKKLAWTEADFNKRIAGTNLLNGTNSSVLTEGNAAVMLYNMLKEPVLIVESITNKGAEYKTSADKTYITEKCSLLKCSGEIRADGEAAAVGIEPTGKGKVNIGGEIYYYDGDLKNNIGYTAEFYATDIKSEDIQTIIYLEIKEPSAEITIDAEDIQSFSKGTLKYEYGGRTKTEYINRNKASIFVNGANAENVTDTLFTPQYGNLRLADFDGDGTFDSVFVTSVVYIKVAQVNTTDYTIVDSDMKYEIVSDEDAFDSDGGIEGIANGSIIAFAPSDFEYKYINGQKIPMPKAKAKHLKAQKIETAESGTVKSYNEDMMTISDGENEVSFEYSKWFKLLVNAGVYKLPDTDSSITVYADNGKIVYADVNSIYGGANKKYTYGYLVKMSMNNGTLENPQFKIYTEEGIMEKLEASDNLKIDGARASTADKIKNTKLCRNGETVKQLVCFDLTEDGKLKTLYTARDFASKQITDEGGNIVDNPSYDPNYRGYNESCFSYDYGCAESEKITYRNGFRHLYTLDEQATKVFVVPSDSEDEKYFQLRTPSYFINTSQYSVKLYDVQKNFVPSAVVCMVKASAGTVEIPLELYPGNPCAIVMKTSQAIDDEGEIRPQITVMENGYPFKVGAPSGVRRELFASDDEMTSYNGTRYSGGIYPSVKFKDLVPGDVIMFKTNDMGEISGYRVLTRYNDLYDENGNFICREININDPTASMYITCGKVVDIFDDYSFTFNIDPNENVSGLRYCYKGINSTNFAVNLYDPTKSSKVISCTSKEIRIGDYIVTRSESGSALEVFIFRK